MYMKAIVEKINILLTVFTRVVTTILIISSVYNYVFFGTERILSVLDIFGILLIGLVSALCQIPFLREIEYSKKMAFLINTLSFIVINGFCLFVGFFRDWFSFENMATILAFELVVILVYVIVMVVCYKIDSSNAEKMNQQLQKRKSKSE